MGDAFRAAGAKAVTAEYDIDQMFEHGRNIVNGVIADGCALPIATGAVDVSYSLNVLEHVVSYRSMLAEMVRVVAPGGVIDHVHQLALALGWPRDIAVALPRG